MPVMQLKFYSAYYTLVSTFSSVSDYWLFDKFLSNEKLHYAQFCHLQD